ncbi:hypothetical protein [Martelella endophytica]|uniref:Uncharacterized protein n=1 Tax=Martelella endophytica TaxID=1486262 RepID=A0A0D5LW39_MAREN|nr:hypothetical protein [Martelella endophytica]AJY47608.1 hypothetical protein TM49_21135 [Martelella endophytica]
MTSVAVLAVLTPITACSVNEGVPLLYGQTTTFGVAAGTSPSSPKIPELVVGLKHANVAVVPTVVPKDQQSSDQSQPVRIAAQGGLRAKDQDALSTYGSFGGAVSGGRKKDVDASIFFSTGIAAQYLAAGELCVGMPADQINDCVQQAFKATSSPLEPG